MRCTEATLEALGITGVSPQFGTGVLEALQNAGRKTRHIDLGWNPIGLRDFIEARPMGSFYLMSKGHAMALVDGQLTDTSERNLTNRIKVLCAVEVV